ETKWRNFPGPGARKKQRICVPVNVQAITAPRCQRAARLREQLDAQLLASQIFGQNVAFWQQSRAPSERALFATRRELPSPFGNATERSFTASKYTSEAISFSGRCCE